MKTHTIVFISANKSGFIFSTYLVLNNWNYLFQTNKRPSSQFLSIYLLNLTINAKLRKHFKSLRHKAKGTKKKKRKERSSHTETSSLMTINKTKWINKKKYFFFELIFIKSHGSHQNVCIEKRYVRRRIWIFYCVRYINILNIVSFNRYAHIWMKLYMKIIERQTSA